MTLDQYQHFNYISFKFRLIQWSETNQHGILPLTLTVGTRYDISWFGKMNFLFTTVSRKVLGPTEPSIECVPGALSLELKRAGREADHLPPPSAEVKNAWSYTSTPLMSSWRGA
jgi:hypothetical protein